MLSYVTSGTKFSSSASQAAGYELGRGLIPSRGGDYSRLNHTRTGSGANSPSHDLGVLDSFHSRKAAGASTAQDRNMLRIASSPLQGATGVYRGNSTYS